MSPFHNVHYFTLWTCLQLLEKGHSRVPVYRGSRDNICGMLLVKKLIQLDPEDSTPIQTLEGAHVPPPSCLTTTPLYQQLNQFQTGRSKWVGLDSVVEDLQHFSACFDLDVITQHKPWTGYRTLAYWLQALPVSCLTITIYSRNVSLVQVT